MGAMDHKQDDADEKPTAGIQDPGANVSIATFSSGTENKWRKALERCVPAIVVLKCVPG